LETTEGGKSRYIKMAKSKLATPDWIKEGYDSPEEYAKSKGKPTKKKEEKTFKVRKCPKCGSDQVNVVLTGEEGKGTKEWECRKCKWVGKNIKEDELTEDEFMKYLDEKGESVA
jgi:ribosomal protein L37AE/L43A